MAIRSEPYLINDVAEDSMQTSLAPDERLTPLGPKPHPEYIQLAGLWDEAGAKVGLALGRLIKPIGRNDYGSAYRRFSDTLKQRQLQEREALELAKKHEVKQTELEETFRGVDGVERRYQLRPIPRHKPASLRSGGLYHEFEAVDNATGQPFGLFRDRQEAEAHIKEAYGHTDAPKAEPALIEEPDLRPERARTVVEEEVGADEYVRWRTLGTEELDTMREGVTRVTQPQDGLLGGVRVIGKRGDEKIPDEGNIYSIIENTAAALEKNFARLGDEEIKTITNQQTRALANLLGKNDDTIKSFFFSGGFQLKNASPGHLAAIMVAGKDLLVKEIQILDELTVVARNKETNTTETKIAWMRQSEYVANLLNAYRGKVTDIARAQQAFKMSASTDKDLMNLNIREIVDRVGGEDQIDDAIEAYALLPEGNLPGKTNYLRQLTKWQKFTNSMHEMWVNSLLSGWFTHTKNFVGVAATISLDIAATGVTATRQAVVGGTGKPFGFMRDDRDVKFGDLGAEIFASVMSTREAMRAAGRAFWLREDPIEGAEMSIVAGIGHNNPDALSAEGLQWGGFAGTAANWFGNLVTLGRAPTRMLQAEDGWWKTIAYRKELWKDAWHQGRAKNLQGEEFDEFVADFVMNPPAAAAAAAKKQAKYVTLQSDMEGALLHGQKAVRGWAGRTVIPFYKTPTNAILYVGDHSPVARWMKRYKDAKKQGGKEFAKARSRMQIGMGITALLIHMYTSDKIEWTGNLSSDPALRRAHLRMGRKPYSVRIGNTYVNYNFIEPISSIIGLVADAFEIMNHKDTDERTAAEVGLALAGVIGYNLTNKTFMTGLSGFIEAVNEPDGYHGSKFMTNYMKGLVPGSAAWNDWKRIIDDVERLRLTFRDEYFARLPGLSETLPPRRDLWGRVSSYSRIRSDYAPNPVDKEIVRLNLPLSEHPTSIEYGGKDFPLQHAEVDFLHMRAGTVAYETLHKIIAGKNTKAAQAYAKLRKSSENGNELASQQMQTMIRNVINDARIQAEADLLGSNNALVESPWNYQEWPGGPTHNMIRDELQGAIDEENEKIRNQLEEINTTGAAQ